MGLILEGFGPVRGIRPVSYIKFRRMNSNNNNNHNNNNNNSSSNNNNSNSNSDSNSNNISLDNAKGFAVYIEVVVPLLCLFNGMIASQAGTHQTAANCLLTKLQLPLRGSLGHSNATLDVWQLLQELENAGNGKPSILSYLTLLLEYHGMWT